MSYSTIVSMTAKIQNNIINIHNGTSEWASLLKNAPHAILLTDAEMLHKMSEVKFIGFYFNGYIMSEADLGSKPLGFDIRCDYITPDGYGSEHYTKIEDNLWCMHYEDFSCWWSQRDYRYDPFDGITMLSDCIEMNASDEDDTYYFLEDKMSRPRGSQKYKAK